jgi:hypothetical protein
MKDTDSKPPTPPPPEDSKTVREVPMAQPTDPKKDSAPEGTGRVSIPKPRKYPKPLR